MRVLITGGCGFVGFRLVNWLLLNTTHEIALIDNLSYAGDFRRILQLNSYDPRRVRFYFHDLRSPIREPLAKEIDDVNAIINLAAASHVDSSVEFPSYAFLNNVSATLNTLEFAKLIGVKTFLHVSTDEVMGQATPGQLFSDNDKHNPSNPYAASKSAQEQLCTSFRLTYGVPTKVVRFMNIIGEGQHEEKFVPKSIKLILSRRPVPVHSIVVDGQRQSGSRTYCYADNYCAFLAHILEKDYSFTEVNVPGDQEVTNLEMVVKIAGILGLPAKYEYVDVRPGHDFRYALSSTVLPHIEWKPQVTFSEGLINTVNYFVRQHERFRSNG